MCGIAGYWGQLPVDSAAALVHDMNAALAHRGPDGEGMWLGSNVGFGHRRLAIIDVTGGAQPMVSADGRYHIVFNGEIYNYRELRQHLMSVGYLFHTHADTEVIPATIDHWGIEPGLRRLRGMFAFALYDQREDCLLLARDPFGIKPLYIGQAPGVLLFASEPKALFTYPGLLRQADAVALLDFFSLGAPLSPHTCWSTVRELEPGTWRQYSRHAEHHGRFWDWEAAAVEPLTEAEGLERLETVLCEALQLHLESDVPLAAFLSGGIDSSLVVALLCKHFVPGLPTFHMGFDEAAYDESRYARAVAQHCSSQHHESRIAAGEGTPELFQRIVAHYDQPFGDSSCLPTWLICQEMARHTKVVLSGDGGDELFGGYDRYLQARQLTTLAQWPMLRWLAATGGRLFTMTHPDLARKLYKASTLARLPHQSMLCGLLTYFTLADARALFKPDFLRLALAEGETAERFARYIPTELADPLAQLMAAESRSLLHYDFLRKIDVASSAHGLEVRTPFVDIEVFNFAIRLPITLKVRQGSLKVLPRLLARRLLPASVIERPKQGFAIPFDRWAGPKLREFLHDLLLSPTARCRDWLRPERVEAILQVFANNTRPVYLSRFQASHHVFLLAAFELWLRQWAPSAP